MKTLERKRNQSLFYVSQVSLIQNAMKNLIRKGSIGEQYETSGNVFVNEYAIRLNQTEGL